MRRALIEDYKNPSYRTLASAVLNNILLQNKRVPTVVAMDSSIVHYKHWASIVFNPKVKDGWASVLRRYCSTDAYKRLNEVVHGDPLLAKYAAVRFLNSLIEKSEELKARYYSEMKEGQSSQGQSPQSAVSAVLDYDGPSSLRMQAMLVEALEKEAEKIESELQLANSFSHFGMPVARLLENPDEFRKIAANKIIVSFIHLLKGLRREAADVRRATTPTLIGGRPLGARRILRLEELPSALPSELIDEDLFSYKVASRGLLVRERFGSVNDYVVYLDKSGSMAWEIPFREEGKVQAIPKISFAAASAIALANKLRQYGARLTLKFFDTEVHDPVRDFQRLIEELLRIKAESGTNITNVLEDALQNYRDERIIVVTDGIDYEVDEEVVKRASRLDITYIFIDTDNALLRRHARCVHLKEARPSILLEV
ncbi:MAG: hypothetical protein QXP84_07515 [Candidatus Korarchaeum sp.]